MRRGMGPVALSLCALVCGGPLYLALAQQGALPHGWRHRPWPLEALAAALSVAALALAARGLARRTPGARRALAWGVAAAIATTTFSASARLRAHELPPSPATLPVGRPAPDFALRDDAGHGFSLASLRGAPSLLVFFRGAACPYCRRQLTEVARSAAAFADAGVRVVGVSADTPAVLARLRGELGLRFPLVSDEREEAVTALCGGVAHCEILVDAAGIVRWGAFSESWSEAPPPDDLVEAASLLAGLQPG